MRIADLGEFGLIRLIRDWTGHRAAAPAGAAYRLAVGNGDDAAAVDFSGDPVTELYTTDTMVEGIHFTAATMPWRDLGWKAMASNISDVAAMGGAPGMALVTLGLPADFRVADVKELYSGMIEIGEEFGTRIIGGDLVRSPVAFITVALTGIADGLLRRDAAAPGHLIAVAGPVGGAAGGLRLLLAGRQPDSAAKKALIGWHRRPRPQIAAGQSLVEAGVRAAMDVSDGLADDLGKLCAASGVSAVIYADKAPAPDALRSEFPDDWLDLALYGGEDYVLLFTAPPEVMATALDRLPTSAVIIGAITEGQPGTVTVLDSGKQPRPRGGAGWDHFAN